MWGSWKSGGQNYGDIHCQAEVFELYFKINTGRSSVSRKTKRPELGYSRGWKDLRCTLEKAQAKIIVKDH